MRICGMNTHGSHTREHGPYPGDQEPPRALQEVSSKAGFRKILAHEWKESRGSGGVDQCLGRRGGKKGWEEEEEQGGR